jgi:hypothetical protein
VAAPQKLEGNILLDASNFSGVGSRVEVSDVGREYLFLCINGVSERTFPFSPSVDGKVVRCWCTAATCIVSKNPSLTTTSFGASNTMVPDVLNMSSGAVQYHIEWPVKVGETVYFRCAGSSNLGFTFRPTPDFLQK